MDVEAVKRLIERRPNLSTALGMDFVSTPENDICKATMTVDERNRQPSASLVAVPHWHWLKMLPELGRWLCVPTKYVWA